MSEIEVIVFPVFSYVMTFVFDEKMIEIGATTFSIFSKSTGFLLGEK